MARRMVRLLAAVGTTISALVGLVHGDLTWVDIADTAAAGLAAYLAAGLPPNYEKIMSR